MSTSHGQFVWCELITPDAPSAISFYGSVFGWNAKPARPPNQDYTILSAGEAGVGGLFEIPRDEPEAGSRPGWIGYIAVDDVDTALERLRDAGGHVRRPATDIPGTGRFALVSDPQGAPFALLHPLDRQSPTPGTPPAFMPPAFTSGHVGWHELQAADGQTAFTFYADQFGWSRSDAIDMGPMGIYQIFGTGSTGAGGMMTRTNSATEPFWLHYINVEQIEPAVERVKQAGGTIIMGPNQVPGGSWIAQCLDPHKILFAMVAPNPGT